MKYNQSKKKQCVQLLAFKQVQHTGDTESLDR